MKEHFSITPRVISHLGEGLIKNESIAILELVKNAYDACATECRVDFFSKDKKLKKIIISDNGCGMNIDIIRDIWLVIGTDNKKEIKPNACGRYPLGEKGIGRLGVHKLGTQIHLISKKDNNKEVELFIDWSNLEKVKQIDDFGIELLENDNPKFFNKKQTGTVIIIEELKSNWDRRKLREVYRDILSLNSPFSDSNDTFKVNVNSNENIFEGMPTIDEVKDSGLYFGSCTLKGNRIVDFKYEFKPWSSLDKIDKREIYLKDLKEGDLSLRGLKHEKGKKVEYDIDLDKLKIGEIKFDIIIFEKDSAIFNLVVAEKESINGYLGENGGVRVYRDNVRVYNYGEKGNDWLGIDLRRVNRVGGNVSNNIVLGSVRIKRKESVGLVEKTNREGFIENEEYVSFVDTINYVLDIFVRLRNEDKNRLTTLYKVHKVAEPVLSDLNDVIEIVKNKVYNEQDRNEILKYLYRINKQYSEVKDVLIKSANAGLNLSVVVHEIEKLIAALLGHVKRGDNKKTIDITMALEKVVRGYSAMVRKSKIGETLLSDIVKTAIENYGFRFSDHKINVYDNYKNCELKAFLGEAEAISVLTNLLDNSIFWVCRSRQKDRCISIYITDQIDGFNSIIVSDNGPGFNIGTDVAVQPFITGKPHNLGMGLGLHIANEMMKAMKGKILFLEEKDIDLPKYVKDNEINKAIIALCFPKEQK